MERGLIIKEDPYCSGRLLLWRGKIYNTGTLIPWGLLHRGGAMTIQRTIIIKGTITIEGAILQRGTITEEAELYLWREDS